MYIWKKITKKQIRKSEARGLLSGRPGSSSGFARVPVFKQYLAGLQEPSGTAKAGFKTDASE